jgi:hypothetical protein
MLTRYVRLPQNIILLCTLLSLFGAPPVVHAATKIQVDRIRTNSILSDTDLQEIDAYVTGALDTMLVAKKPEDLDKIRKQIISSSKSNSQTRETRNTYNQRFAATIQAHYPSIANQLAGLEDHDIARHIELTLCIIIAETDHPDLCGDLIALLDNENAWVRYWALKGLSTETMVKFHLSQESTSDLVQDLVAGLRNALSEETNSLLISQIVVTASLPKFPEALKVVRDCLEKRWTFYNQWKVSDELTDITSIQNTLEIIGKGSLAENRELQNDLIYSVGKLFSAGLQRYKTGMQYKDNNDKELALLDPDNQHKLQSFLIESERSFRKACSRIDANAGGNSRFFKAIQSRNWTSIDEAYERLLGIDGDVNRVFKLYSNSRKFPYPPLADPPELIVERAKTRQYVENNTFKAVE